MVRWPAAVLAGPGRGPAPGTRSVTRPFQQWNSVSVAWPALPTAQKPAPCGMAAAPISQSSPRPGLGLAATDQADPVQCSARVRNAAPWLARCAPTAHALVVPLAATACNEL